MATNPVPAGATQEQEVEILRHAVGTSISQWTHVESALVSVVTRCIAPIGIIMRGGYVTSGFGMAGFIIHAHDSFNPMRNITNEIITGFLWPANKYTALLEDWGKINDKLRTKSGYRNKLAHWTVIIHPNNQPGRRALLTQPFENPDRDPSVGYDSREVLTFGENFRVLAEEVSSFGRKLTEVEELHDKFAVQVAHQIEHYDRQDPIVAARLRQLLPLPPKPEGWDEGY